MLERLGDRAEFWEIPEASHTELAGREPDLASWLAEKAGMARPPLHAEFA